MLTFRPLRILLLLLALCAIAAYCVPLAQEGGDTVVIVTATTVVPATATSTGLPQSTSEHQRTWLGELLVPFVPTPKRRGTVGIIMSCVLTLFLCVCE